MGSFRFRRSIKIAPGLRLNINKKSVGISTGVRGARYSINSSGRRTRSVGIPGTGLSYRSQSGGQDSHVRAEDLGEQLPSPARLLARVVGLLTLTLFLLQLFANTGGWITEAVAIGIVSYLALRLSRPILDPIIFWLLSRRQAPPL
jgi:hypothetical protein